MADSLRRAPSVPSFKDLEEELTCSICLCVFESPVTTPCGHNFCQSCLEMTWGGQAEFSCPHCRTPFLGRPVLKKNTVLCSVVEQFHSTKTEPPQETWGSPEGKSPPQVPCDSCLEEAAAKTCLTCMASFCQEHLRPHLESRAFQGHQLCQPLRDLQQRKCREHSKLLEYYCKEHASCICCVCLVSHKTCIINPMQAAKAEKERQLKNKLTELYNLGEKASQSLDEVRVQQKQASEMAARKLDLLKNEYVEIKALIEQEENESLKKVEDEETRVSTKFDYVYNVLGRKKNEIQTIRDQIEMMLVEDDDIVFLQKTAKLRQSSIKDVFIPRNDLDQSLIHGVYQRAFGLKETVKCFVAQPQEKKVVGGAQWKPKAFNTSKPQVPGRKNPGANAPQEENPFEKSQQKSREDVDSKERRKPPKAASGPGKKTPTPRAPSASRASSGPIESFLTNSREELLQYPYKITLDFNTVHNKVILSEGNTKMSVSETPQNYGIHPRRFNYCSQVLGYQCFKQGTHYWEVDLEHHNFCGIGICYGSMERQGADSRLGRNSSSWCIEWFNAKISAWHNDVEKRLPNTKATRVGVLLSYEGGFVIFFGLAEKMNVIYKFRAQFTEALYPAFWLFSSGTTLSVCQLK
uniref:RING-type E3 ubiquitin transferase n=1 Tax=Sphenodon punctatus TaxID=8508 RepID=A0A8D0L4H6_SPHPU